MQSVNRSTLQAINRLCFVVILVSIVAAVGIGIAGIWEYIPTENYQLYRLLGTSGAVFLGAMIASMAIAWFKANED